MEKPLILALDEAEKETFVAINGIMRKHNLSCAFFEPIVAKVHRQLEDGKSTEIENAKRVYEEGKQNEQKDLGSSAEGNQE